MLFETLVEVRIKIESRVRCIDIYDNHCTLAKISTYNTYFRQYFSIILKHFWFVKMFTLIKDLSLIKFSNNLSTVFLPKSSLE